MPCRVCKRETVKIFVGKILNKYEVNYFRCKSCGFIQTEEPFWLEESYNSAINEIDIGPVNRAMTGSRLTEGIILSNLDRNEKFIDYGGGYGIFVRLMRDKGFDFY